MTEEDAQEMILNGKVTGGMIPKVECGLTALRKGVRKVHVIDGRIPHSVLLEIFPDAGVGTEIVSGKGEGSE
jgi:acetylglutamate kinase